MMRINYRIGQIPPIQDIIAVYDSSGLRRPTSDHQRIEKMYANSNLVITAWDADQLVGVARSLTDYSYACYLSDVAVRVGYQNRVSEKS